MSNCFFFTGSDSGIFGFGESSFDSVLVTTGLEFGGGGLGLGGLTGAFLSSYLCLYSFDLFMFVFHLFMFV